MTNRIKLFLSSFLSIFVFTSALIATQDPANARIITPAEAAAINANHPFFGNRDLRGQALEYFDYSDLCKMARASKGFRQGAIDVRMKEGWEWVEWVRKMIAKGLSTKAIAMEVAASLARVPWYNPDDGRAPALIWLNLIENSYTNRYHRYIPDLEQPHHGSSFNDRFWHSLGGNGSSEKGGRIPETNEQLLHDDTLVKIDPKNITALVPCLEELRPYAIAATMRRLLTNRSYAVTSLTVPSTEQRLVERWVAAEADISMLHDYLHYVRAAYTINLKLHGNIAQRREVFLSTHDLYSRIAARFKCLPLTEATFAAEDQLIELYKRHLCDLENLLKDATEAARLDIAAHKLKLAMNTTRQGYEKFLSALRSSIIASGQVSFREGQGYTYANHMLARRFNQLDVLQYQENFMRDRLAPSNFYPFLLFTEVKGDSADRLMRLAAQLPKGQSIELYTWIRTNVFEFIRKYAKELAACKSEMAELAQEVEKQIAEIDQKIVSKTVA